MKKIISLLIISLILVLGGCKETNPIEYYAEGVYAYQELDEFEKAKVLSVLEGYAMDAGLTGITLAENGSYQIFSERLSLPTEKYIPGYGFGLLEEGKITSALAAEENEAWKMYYHTYLSSDTKTVNFLKQNDLSTETVFDYLSATYYVKFLNKEKNGYVLVPELAKDDPVAINLEDGLATKWKIPVRTGEEIRYSSNSTIDDRVAFDNRQVNIADYLTPYKLMFTRANNYQQGIRLIQNPTVQIKGLNDYFIASKTGYDDKLWNNVGLNAYTDSNGQGWIEYEFNNPITKDIVMEFVTNKLLQPIPQEFIDVVGANYYGSFNENDGTTPIDNSLVLGPYELELWSEWKEIVLSKNQNYIFASDKYQIEGIHIEIYAPVMAQASLYFKRFLNGYFDVATIPLSEVANYVDDDRVKIVTGNKNMRININATDNETWDYLFGKNGVVNQISSEEERYELEPALSNLNFRNGLSFAIDRQTFANKIGQIPSINYLPSSYLLSYTSGVSYANTKEHQDVVKRLLDDTDGYGYSLSKARESFKLAINELVEQGMYKEGTIEEPTIIELEIAWMYPQYEATYHQDIELLLETAFNHESVTDNKFKLDVTFWAGEKWEDVIYNKIMKGQFDLACVSVEADDDIWNEFGKLSIDSTISNSMTFDWAIDTNKVSEDIYYDGKYWSYDALWTVLNEKAVVKGGELVHIFDGAKLVNQTINADGSYMLEIEFVLNSGEEYHGKIDDLVLFGYNDVITGRDYLEYSLLFTEDGKTDLGKVTRKDLGNGVFVYTINLSKEDYMQCLTDIVCGIDVHYSIYINDEIVKKSYQTIELEIN